MSLALTRQQAWIWAEDLDTFGEEDGDLGKSEGAHPARLPREGAKASPEAGGGDIQLFTPPMRFVDMDD